MGGGVQASGRQVPLKSAPGALKVILNLPPRGDCYFALLLYSKGQAYATPMPPICLQHGFHASGHTNHIPFSTTSKLLTCIFHITPSTHHTLLQSIHTRSISHPHTSITWPPHVNCTASVHLPRTLHTASICHLCAFYTQTSRSLPAVHAPFPAMTSYPYTPTAFLKPLVCSSNTFFKSPTHISHPVSAHQPHAFALKPTACL